MDRRKYKGSGCGILWLSFLAGSTFKILTAYAPALDSGSYTLATTVLDEPITYSSGKEIHNADGKYRGYTSIREAIQDSVNVVAVKTVQDITPQAGYEMAKKFGISTLTKDDDCLLQ